MEVNGYHSLKYLLLCSTAHRGLEKNMRVSNADFHFLGELSL